MNRIDWTSKATKQLLKIRLADVRQNVYDAVQVLVDFPNCSNVKALTEHDYGYRLRVGEWRVMFNFDGAIRIISVEEVRKRNERTY